MKNLLLFTLLFISTSSFSFAQSQFRVDYDVITFYDPETADWGDWQLATNTIVFNINENMDIKHYTPKGEVIVYRNMGGHEEGYTKGGEHYQMLRVLDDGGDEMLIQLFDNPDIGMKLIMGQYMIQFAKQ
jgi:hypothetical protein